jgi:hypothetical protein
VEAERERQPCKWLCKYAGSARTGAVRSTEVSSCVSRGVRSARLWHRMCVGRGRSIREQENPKVRGEVGLANPSGFIVSSHGPRHPAVPTLVDRSTNRHHHKSPRGLPLRPFSTHYNPQQASSSSTESRPHRAFLFADPVATRLHFPSVLLYNQGYPKVCPVSLNLLNAGDSLPEYHHYLPVLFFPYQGLNCFDLESSRVFFVKCPKPSLF